MTSVQRPHIVDVSGIKSYGVRAVVLLASSLGWNVVMKPNEPVTLIARDGHRIKVPTTTTVKTANYQGYISSIITHSHEYTPTIELIDSIIQIVRKLNQDEERRLRLAVGEDVRTHRARMAAIEEGARESRDQPLTQRIEVPPIEWVEPEPAETKPAPVAAYVDAVVKDEPVPDTPRLVSSKPLMTRAFKGLPSREMAFVLEQTWSDGTTTYKCRMCDFTSDFPKAVSGHGKKHGAKTEAGKQAKLLREAGRAALAGQEAERGALEVIEQIRELVGFESAPSEELELLREENEQLREEMAQVQAKYDKMKTDWDALRGLLGGS